MENTVIIKEKTSKASIIFGILYGLVTAGFYVYANDVFPFGNGFPFYGHGDAKTFNKKFWFAFHLPGAAFNLDHDNDLFAEKER